jgi:hypothetical protein
MTEIEGILSHVVQLLVLPVPFVPQLVVSFLHLKKQLLGPPLFLYCLTLLCMLLAIDM